MLRLIVISASLLAVAACDSKPATPSSAPAGSAAEGPGSQAAAGSQAAGAGSQAAAAAHPRVQPPSSLAKVQSWARGWAPGATVAATELTAAGIELFSITPEKQTDEDFPPGELVGLLSNGPVVRKLDVVRAAVAGKADAKMLARIAMWIGREDGELLTAAATPEQRKAGVRAPTIKGNTLKFWVWTTDEPRILERGSVDLTTGAIEIGPLPGKPEVMVSNAIKMLVGANVRRHPSAILQLVAQCTNPRAKESLLAAMSSHPRDKTRTVVIDEIHKCGAAVVDPLIYVMENDKSAMIRTRAASALGRVGESRARPALAKAARSEDANLVWAAKNSLGKLK